MFHFVPMPASPLCRAKARALRTLFRASLAIAALTPSLEARADDDPPPDDDDVDQVTVQASRPRRFSASESTFSIDELSLRPRTRPADLLTAAPGLVSVQHAGGGKAAQYFLRGFDVDHGTDLALFVDGVPVNMPTHGHGQGYADLHFVIPEVLGELRVRPGPYHAEYGDFATAGALELTLSEALPDSQVSATVGQYGVRRGVGVASLRLGGGSDATLAAEAFAQDGPFENPERLRRLNLFARMRRALAPGSTLSLTWMSSSARWNASGQIPTREVDAGRLSRFGSIDPSEGGSTQRHGVTLGLDESAAWGSVRARLYAIRYRFGLYSNFTFFLEDRDNGDQIEQTDQRDVLGADVRAEVHHPLGPLELTSHFGVQMRHDAIDNGLYRDVSRRRLDATVLSNVAQTSLGAFVEESARPVDWLRLRAALRIDRFDASVDDRGTGLPEPTATSGAAGALLASPKATIAWLVVPGVEAFASFGRGFHSNDARGAVREDGRARFVVPATGYELGLRWNVPGAIMLTTTGYRLDLDGEQVYVGDAGTTEPSGPTTRIGVETSVDLALGPWVRLDAALTLNRGRFRDAPSGEDSIPLAPGRTLTAGLSARSPWGSSASLRLRHVSSRPADESGGLRAEGWTLLAARIGHRQGPFEASIAIDNLIDQRYAEVQFATESQLRTENAPVREIHFAPGWPRTVQATLRAYFE